MDTVKTVRKGQVRGDLGLRIDPGAVELVVKNTDRTGHNGESSTVTDSGDSVVSGVAIPEQSGEGRSGDVSSREESLDHSGRGGGDVEGETESTGGDTRGDEVSLLVEDLVSGDVLALPGGGVLDDLSEGLGVGKAGKSGPSVVGDRVKDHQVTLAGEKLLGSFKFLDSHILFVF